MKSVRSAIQVTWQLVRNARPRHALPGVALLVAASAFAQKTESPEALVRRYPFDPACAFGRIANGKGMIVRCISEDEANQLLKRSGAGPNASTPAASPPGPAPTGAGGVGAAAPPAGNESSDAASEGAGGPGSAALVGDERLDVTVGPITADQGELSLGKLTQPKARYARCVLDHGGMRERSGEVHVRFLVRSKGIAEGVSVQKRSNLSAEAARCVAEIVDRRRVGVPDAPLVGATVVIKFERPGK